MNQASVGFHCPECARSGRQKVYNARSLMNVTPYATLALIAVNVAVFVADILMGTSAAVGPGQLTNVSTIADRGSLLAAGIRGGDWWQPVTAGFIHYGLIHIGFNMVLLYQLGRLLEPALGRARFLALYFMALLGGSFLVLVISPDQPTAGASGAVFGLMGAAVVAFRSRGISAFQTGIGQLIVLNLVFTFAFAAEISVGGHVGGLIAGFVGGWLLFEAAPRIPNGKYLMPLLVTVAAVGLYVGCLVIANNHIN
jgi:membrane associated rhomboid family serine protease